jgi:hypothetical protein
MRLCEGLIQVRWSRIRAYQQLPAPHVSAFRNGDMIDESVHRQSERQRATFHINAPTRDDEGRRRWCGIGRRPWLGSRVLARTCAQRKQGTCDGCYVLHSSVLDHNVFQVEDFAMPRWLALRGVLRASSRIRPSSMRNTRSACSIRRGSWLTQRTVV